jgi:phage shock protein PspC (stress-responsive transcriptional regulator)
MTYPSPTPAPKKLERSRSNRLIGGVCGGLAEYLNMDPTLVRVLTVVLSLFTGVPVVIYLVLLLVVPEEGSSTQPSVPPANPGGYGQTISGPAQPTTDPMWGPGGAPWQQQSAATQPKPAEAEPAQSPEIQPKQEQPPGENPLR